MRFINSTPIPLGSNVIRSQWYRGATVLDAFQDLFRAPLAIQILKCIRDQYTGLAGEGNAGSPSPPRRRRAVSRRPTAATCLDAAARPMTGILSYTTS